jgi:hypothetical protein
MSTESGAAENGESDIKQQYYTTENRQGFVMMARSDLILKGHLAMRGDNKEVPSAAQTSSYQPVYVVSTIDGGGSDRLSVRGIGQDNDGAAICGGCCKVANKLVPIFRSIVDSTTNTNKFTIGTVAHPNKDCAGKASNLLCFFGQVFDQVDRNI